MHSYGINFNTYVLVIHKTSKKFHIRPKLEVFLEHVTNEDVTNEDVGQSLV